MNADNTYVYILNTERNMDQELIDKYALRISLERRKKIAKLHNKVDMANSICAELLLKFVLQHEFACTEKIDFRYGKYGKPFLMGNIKYSFSISHTYSFVAVGVSKRNVGIDIEDINNLDIGLSKEICKGNEREMFSISKNKTELLTQFWVCKEAYGKYLGSGLNENVLNVDFSCINEKFNKFNLNFEVFKIGNSVLSVCGDSKDIQIKMMDLKMFIDLTA